MKRALSTTIFSLLIVCILLLTFLSAAPIVAVVSYPFQPSDAEVASALDYIRAQQEADGSVGDVSSSAWVVMAIAAAEEDPNDWKIDTNPSIVDYLAANASSADTATDYARMLLAIAAADEDPTNFGGRDFVSLLESTHDGTQIGDDTLLNDDFWGIMGLIAAGESPTSNSIDSSVDFILSNQNGDDGGWSWGVGADSDVDDTVAAIMALVAAGESPSSSAVTDALAFIKSTQMQNGGFESWGASNADTDSWAIGAIVAAGQDPTDAAWTSGDSYTPVDDLLTFQQDDGSFYWQIDNPGMSVAKTTACAITALLGKPFPVTILPPREATAGATVNIRIEGQSQTVWSGNVTVDESSITADNSGATYHLEDPTALGALDEASQLGGFPYETTDEYGSLFVTSINDEEPQGMSGWLYWVDYYSPMVGAADFVLNETTPPNSPHQEVIFYYGEWDMLPLKIEVDITEADVDEQFTTTVTQCSDDTWSPCEGATVHADQDYITGPDGTVDITIATDMTFNLYAEKEGFIRSNRVRVTIGTGIGDSSEVRLAADIIPAISFTVDPSSIDFGELGPRDTSSPHTLTITNTGAWDLLIACNVTDSVDDLFVDGLKLDEEVWGQFEVVIERNDYSECECTLTVPENYIDIGEKNGTIIFWAVEAP